MYLIQTVQTSWRPQLPLPKELQLTDERHSADDNNTKANNNNTNTTTTATTTTTTDNHQEEEDMDRLRMSGGSSQQLSNKQKWSFGRLFRNKKKDTEDASSSEEEDRKAGFVPAQRQSATKPKSKTQHPAKSKAAGFDHIVHSTAQHPGQPTAHIDNEFFLPVEMMPPVEPFYQNQPALYSRSSNSLDRRLYLTGPTGQPGYPAQLAPKSRSVQRAKPPAQPGQQPAGHSSEEELISLNSSTFSKYRSDESMLNAANMPGQSRRSRAARNERYYKRLSRDGEVSHGGVPAQFQQPAMQQQRYKTQPLPLSIYQAAPAAPPLSSVPAPLTNYVQWQPRPSLQNSIQNDAKRSISYDSHIHLQNAQGRMQSKPLPPPPPPRDPLRRVCHMGSSSSDLRPVSYAFDQSSRCVSDERIWQPPHYQSVHSLNSQPSGGSIASAPVHHHRRFITRNERNALPGKKSLPNGIDFHYVADATPRSRKPIHLLESANEPPSSGQLRTSKSGLPTSDSWQPSAKPRSISSSRLSELRSYPMPMYSEVLKPKRTAAAVPAPEPAGIIHGSLRINPRENYVEMRQNRRSGEDLPNKYEAYVAEKREQHQQAPVPSFPERKAPPPPVYLPRKKPANLEEAINELEAIYKSLGLTEPAEPQPEPKPELKPRLPTPSDFEKFALAHAADYDDEDSPTGEPDPVRDDVAYRQLQLANLPHRSGTEKQPPFGIPVGPIVQATQSDYLHMEPVRAPKQKKSGSPDIVQDDLAVRALRKDAPGSKSSYPAMYAMPKKQRATRTQSANIYNLIQRAAAKPSGGDLSSYMELTRSIERAGSMSNLAADDASASDIPATLELLRKLKAQDVEQQQQQQEKPPAHLPFRHPSQMGAIAQLPARLNQEEMTKLAPVAAPRKSLTPEPLLEDALNKLAQDAQASSLKLSQELQELRKEALITAARPKLNPEHQKLEQDLEEIEAVSEAAKRCGQLLLDTLPDQDEVISQQQQSNPRKLQKEVKLIRAIDEVSEAANAVCEKILKDIVTTEPPVVVHEALQVKQPEQALVMPHLIKKLDPIQSDKIEAIAKRCMRQLSELAESTPDYDNLPAACNISTAGAGAGVDATLICPIAEIKTKNKSKSTTRAQAKAQTLEDIDRIMQECERQARGNKSSITTIATTSHSTDDQRTTAPSMSSGQATTASSFSSSSDCLAKSSSPSNARGLSSSITSFNPYSSSDYIKSQSSDYHAPSTDPIKTFSTTSYDVQSTTNDTTISTNTQSTTNTTNNTSDNQTASVTSGSSSSPPLQLTPVGERHARRSSSPSQYNSSEELAAIFGIEEPLRRNHPHTGKAAPLASSAVAATNTRCCDPVTHHTRCCEPAALATNPVLNVELENELEFDVNTTSNSSSTNTTQSLPTNESASSASNCSSHSCKLATIPELEQELEEHDHEEPCLKLSPNFNRIYASKIDIVMTKPEQETNETTVAAPSMTQFDSLSSLEETSSNPDSGNASLADFPLANGHANASIELQTAYNSRFEVKEHYVTEVSITGTVASGLDETESRLGEVLTVDRTEDFPRLPTEEELLESLREEAKVKELTESVSKSDKLIEDNLQTDIQLDEALKIDETLKLSEAVYDVTSEQLLKEQQTEVELDEKEMDEIELDESDLIEIALEEALLESNLIELEIEALLEATKLDEIEIDERELDENKLDECNLNEITLEKTLLEQTKLNESELDECDSVARRMSIVYETPQINLSISELKLNYETKVEQEAANRTTLDEEANKTNNEVAHDKKNNNNNDDIPINDTLARNEQRPNNNEANESETRCRKGLPALTDEQPTTSSKALSVFGEVRTVTGAAAAAAAGGGPAGGMTRGGLTTLEHVLVACTVGLITPNDLLTLCLIVIGVIIIVAIALT